MQRHLFSAQDRFAASSRWAICFFAALTLHLAALFGLIGFFEVQPTFGMSAGTGTIEVGLVGAAPPAEPAQSVPQEDLHLKIESEFKVPEVKKKIDNKKALATVPHAIPAAAVSSGDASTSESHSGAKGATHAIADYLANPAPPYPALSRRLHEEGLVILTVEISAIGTVESAKIKRSSGFERLDDAALHAVRSWRFKPATFGGVPIAGAVDVPIRFNLR